MMTFSFSQFPFHPRYHDTDRLTRKGERRELLPGISTLWPKVEGDDALISE